MKGTTDSYRGSALHLRRVCPRLLVVLALALACGCSSPQARQARFQKRYTAARELFGKTVKECHLPSAEAKGAEQDQLLQQAAAGYQQLLRKYNDQPEWCAQALRSLGNVRAAQGQLDQAIACYRQVGEKYSGYDWEVIQAWKSAADLLWEAGRQAEAKPFYAQIVTRFDTADVPAVMATIVKAAKPKL